MEHRAKEQNRRLGNRVSAWWLIFITGLLLGITFDHQSSGPAFAQDLLPIGQIQGEGHESDYHDQTVRFRAIVTGVLEDENASGTRFYTVFVQDVPGSEDGNPLTSDGLAIFVGARRPVLAIGDIASFGGIVTEFYGLTEIDNSGLYYSIESRNNVLPEPVTLDPPADNQEAADYLERYEGMRVSIPAATVVGPSHPGCGFSIVRTDIGESRIVIGTEHDPVGQIIGVLHPSDVNCDDMPAVSTSDQVTGLAGPLTYHFDRFKIVYRDSSELLLTAAERAGQLEPIMATDEQLVIATFNVNNYFDAYDDTGDVAEPQPSEVEIALKQAKISAAITAGLNCPDIIGLQEVENANLLIELAEQLQGYCGFLYQISHVDGPDQRGADVALLSEPQRVTVISAISKQSCTELETNIDDPTVECPIGQQPLFSRPPLLVEVIADGQPMQILVNHFKSKRGGATETSARRLAQAEYVHRLSVDIQNSKPSSQVLVMGDFNDYSGSAVMPAILGNGELIDVLDIVPVEERYTYIFDGASQLIDWILVSPTLVDKVIEAGIVHLNADYAYQLGQSADGEDLAIRSSDHDIPFVIMDLSEEPITEVKPTTAPVPRADPTIPLAEPDPAPEDETSFLEPTVSVPTSETRTNLSSAEATLAPLSAPKDKRASAPDENSSPEMSLGSTAVLVVAGFFLLTTVILITVVAVTSRRGSP